MEIVPAAPDNWRMRWVDAMLRPDHVRDNDATPLTLPKLNHTLAPHPEACGQRHDHLLLLSENTDSKIYERGADRIRNLLTILGISAQQQQIELLSHTQQQRECVIRNKVSP